MHDPGAEYAGNAELVDERGTLAVEVVLKGYFEPLDGRFHWYGRVAADDAVAQRHQSGATVTVTTPFGAAPGRLSDLDPWGRFRVSGLGEPPF